jgi:ribosomal protein L11 methyltransferase
MPAAAEDVAEALGELTGAGVAIEPPIAALGPDEGYTLDASAPMVVRAYLYGTVSRSRRDEVRRRLARLGLTPHLVADLAWRTIRAEDWAESWKQHYEVQQVGRVVIRPAWQQYEAREGEVVVNLDPGMAFGTGQHPTTRMALKALQELLRPGDHVLDLGAGSGILALAAVALGARSAVAVDTEEQAVKAMRDNLALNDAAGRVRVVHGSLGDVLDYSPYDLVLANINAATLIALASGMHAVLRPGRHVVGGGIIQEREAATLAAIENAGFLADRVLADGEWRSIIARRPT